MWQAYADGHLALALHPSVGGVSGPSRLMSRPGGTKVVLSPVVPDVVGSARRTLEVFDHWKYSLSGWPLGLAAQDGIENLDIPWSQIACIFIGGTTTWKLSQAVKDVVMAAKAMNKWVHAGRVNTPGRFEYFDKMGVDSIDGTGLSRYSHMREKMST